MHQESPFHRLTTQLFAAVNALDLDQLTALVDDDYGIVDIDPDGNAVVIDTKAEWHTYMQENFTLMRTMGPDLRTDVQTYHDVQTNDLAYSVVKFVQHVRIIDTHVANHCLATIVWKRTGTEWKESRWHCSLLKKEVS